MNNKLPPGPENTFNLNADEASFVKMGELFSEYGDIVSVQSEKSKFSYILLNHPDYIKQVMVTDHKKFKKGIGFERVKMLLGNGIIVSDGDFWSTQKEMVKPAFHRKVMQAFSEVMRVASVRLLNEWKQKAAINEQINITQDTSEFALEVILNSLFSEDLKRLCETQGHNPFIVIAEHASRDLELVIKFRALIKYVKIFISDRTSENRYPYDMLSLLMQAKNKKTGIGMDEKALIDEVMTLIIAAHETTAATLNWIWYFISENQHVEQKVLGEVNKLQLGGPPNFQQIEKLAYLRQVINETLRLYPPVWFFSREALVDNTIAGYDIPLGTNVFISPYYMQRHPKYWSNPDQFEPDRFGPDNVKDINRYSYFPFSLGQRRCLGEMFSIIEMQIHIAYICENMRLKYINDQPISLEPLINLRTKNEFLMHGSLRH